ncbi:MAG: hypothetical protein KDE27_21605 [Planctomycetes bacterium]|nr:hypothetical protein [Planctomycetota bacterium]
MLLLAACSTVEWQAHPDDLPDGWRDYRLFVSDAAYVLARDGSAAAEVLDRVGAARAEVAQALGGGDPGRGLVIALSFDDPLPVAGSAGDGGAGYGNALGEWRKQVLGFAAPADPSTAGGFRGPNGETIEIDPEIPLRMQAAPVVGDDPRLALPPALVAAATCVALVPTDSCIATCTDRFIDAALAAQGISSLTYSAMRVFLGDPAEQVREGLREQAHRTLVDTWSAALAVDALPGADPGTIEVPALRAAWTAR